MKKSIIVSAVLATLFMSNVCTSAVEPMQAYAETVSTESVTQVNISGTTSDGFTYSGVKNRITLSNGCTFYVGAYATITGYTGTKTNLVIPSSVDGCTVVGIGNNCFANTSLASVTIPNSVTKIGMRAFLRTKLTSVTIPSSVKLIGDSAFKGTNLTSVTIPSSVTSIGSEAFRGTKLTSVTIPSSVTSIGSGAFRECEKLISVKIPKDCKVGKAAFTGCSSLITVNGARAYTMKQDDNGVSIPVLDEDSARRKVIAECFSTSEGVKFVDDYCTALCDYVVATEIKPWMNDNIKARQLYDWLIRHARYEDEKNGETLYDAENHVYSSVFLSAGLNSTGTAFNGVGETVCEGYSKAYTMLLTAAGMESYLLHGYATGTGTMGHAWNLVKIDDTYYQCDVTWDENYWINNGGGSTEVTTGTSYKYFLKTAEQMDILHVDEKGDPTLSTGKIAGCGSITHPYLNYSLTDGNNALANATTTEFCDANGDGILDYDINLDGKKSIQDGTFVNETKSFFNNGFVLSTDTLDVWLLYLKCVNLSPAEVRALAKAGGTIC
ncbi:leucine-rich repeat protein [uncultured Ruminococcus sp.]|uniref:leucine-rich repeat protein n=1 Tax=uncultured Ruminococcus sp. TaxID=165186 RepID=UPI0025F535EF|nr:leucine-rich repeat protein [uncultured Ruminococcus sp.]